MAGFLDGHTMGVRCPSCDRKNSQTIGWIKMHTGMAYDGCGATISFRSTELASEIKRVEQMLDAFTRGIGKR